MKVYVTASSDEKYTGLLGLHDFESLDDAIQHIRTEALKLNSDFEYYDRFVVEFYQFRAGECNADVIIEIYDDYRE